MGLRSENQRVVPPNPVIIDDELIDHKPRKKSILDHDTNLYHLKIVSKS